MRQIHYAIVICVALMVSGCAEWQNRGGSADWLQDRLVYKADTKHLRIIRSYVMVAALARTAAKAPVYQNERLEVASKIRTATMLVNEAYDCAGGLPEDGVFKPENAGSRIRDTAGCAFFDDIMRQLDSTTLRLARATFLNEENKDLLALLKKEVGQTDPVFDKAFDAVASASELADTGAKLLTREGAIISGVSALVRLGFNAFQTGSRLAPIYRDSIELQMQIALDFLNIMCANYNYDYCSHKAGLKLAFANGAGDLGSWKGVLEPFFDDPNVKNIIAPRPGHFQDVTDLLASACNQLVGNTAFACFPSAQEMRCDLVNNNSGIIEGTVKASFENKPPDENKIDYACKQTKKIKISTTTNDRISTKSVLPKYQDKTKNTQNNSQAVTSNSCTDKWRISGNNNQNEAKFFAKKCLSDLGSKPVQLNEEIVYQKLSSLIDASSLLTNNVPEDIDLFCPAYKNQTPENKSIFWRRMLTTMVGYESNYNTGDVLWENGRYPEFSIGLLQLSISNNGAYSCGLSSEVDLTDAEKNLTCGIKIITKLVTRDKKIGGDAGEQSKGAARYWEVLKSRSDKRAKIIEKTKNLDVCRVG